MTKQFFIPLKKYLPSHISKRKLIPEKWFDRMREYGFEYNSDFYSILSKTSEGGRPATDHQLAFENYKCQMSVKNPAKRC